MSTEFDQVFEDMNARDYPATCDQCGEVGTNASMEEHICAGGELFCHSCNRAANTACVEQGHETSMTGEQCADDCHFGDHDEPPAPRAGERDEWRVFRYARKRILNARGVLVAEAQTEEEAARIVTDHHQHATFVEQREQLLKLLRKSRLILMGAITYSDAEQLHLTETIDEIESTITTIEQEGEASR